ncbi:hypothetical protein [Streptomyces spinosus]|uniref:hypothetical protein n=1 Tax=Streptomyces spinosus TaxID=2872623 RepID=UPI001CECD2FB|nr:hypothetical protein [Streptomyces spinosus]
MPKLPRCAWLLIGAITLLLHHTIGTAATINFLFAALGWALSTPAVLVAVASLAAWHLLNAHTPRRRTARAH